MKRFLLFLFLATLPFAWAAAQPESAVFVSISGVNPSEFPRVVATVNVTDAQGQPLLGLGAADFRLGGTFGVQAVLTQAVNVTDDDLPIATVLAIDVSDSMSGAPLARAKDAALAFIDGLRPDDQVALVVFGSLAQVVQDFTTDRDRLRAVIDALEPVGQTALYQGAYEAVRVAAASPLPRRAVILLGDGVEFGGRSVVGREAALAEAVARGVPVYTVGLGFGADRTYLEELSTGTNAQFYESPTPEALLDIYRGLATRFRSQYILTLDAFVPGDGTIYTLDIAAITPQSTASALASFRAPIPVPIIRFSGVPSLPVIQPFSVMVEVLADQPLAAITFDVPDGQSAQPTPTTNPFPIEIDPLRLMPGAQVYTVIAGDSDGDVGSGSFTIIVDPAIGLTQTETARPTATLTPSATATFTPSPTFTPSATATATATFTLTPSPTFTASATATATQTPTVTPDLRATAEALAMTQTSVAAQATAVQVSTEQAQIALLGTQAASTQSAGTRIAQATQIQATQVALVQAAETQSAQATQIQAALNAQATADLLATATSAEATQVQATQAQAALNAQATADLLATATSAEATSVQATQVQAALDAQATATSVQATQVQAALDAQATATSVQATTNAQATSAQLTQVVVATQAAFTATAATQAALQTQAVSTDIADGATARAQEAAEATSVALLSTQVANAQATAAVQTATANAQATAAAATRSADLAVTALVETQLANLQATAAAQTAVMQTQSAVQTAVAETRAADVTGTALALATQSEQQTQAASTLVAGATQTVQAAQLTLTANAFATQTAAAQATEAQATARILTLTPLPTPALVEAQADNPPSIGDLLPLVCIIAVIAGALAVMFVLLGGNRRRRRRR